MADGTAPEENRPVRRRARADQQNRDYICSCGKSYLSYPALYTHIKQKHDGKAPGTIQLPRSDKSKQKKFVERDEEQEEQTSQILEELHLFLLNNSGTAALPERQCSLEWLFELYLPSDHPERVLTRIEEVLTNQIGCQKVNSLGVYPTKINTIVAKLVASVINKWNPYFVKDLLLVLMLWRRSLNEHFQLADATARPRLQYCDEYSGENMLEVANELVLNLSGKYLEEYAVQGSSVLGGERRDLMLARMVLIISKWLFNEKFTNSKLRVNKDEEAQQKI